MLREKSAGLVQIGVGLLVIGIAVHIALLLGRTLIGLANLAILVGIILAIVGAVMPGRRRF